MDRHDDFREFVLARQQALMRTAYLPTGDAHLAEDLLQTVLIKVARQWSRLSGGGSPEAYTRKALVNQYISWRRRPRPELPSAGSPTTTPRCTASCRAGRWPGRRPGSGR
ncbi:sigma factor [Nonomuraea jiangxiensis]|uniref:Sigma-70 region 2 n=1 Tax=Nonomuraea jiangxiensis TaxID=633440 RepID=A0A1G9B3A0_9ACTN|nr:sigma factor [Nonomuraea jiangxiensis]SDK33315.1 Sigma-70 region 2 [Nonomuraea jiangxiensis]